MIIKIKILKNKLIYSLVSIFDIKLSLCSFKHLESSIISKKGPRMAKKVAILGLYNSRNHTELTGKKTIKTASKVGKEATKKWDQVPILRLLLLILM